MGTLTPLSSNTVLPEIEKIVKYLLTVDPAHSWDYLQAHTMLALVIWWDIKAENISKQ